LVEIAPTPFEDPRASRPKLERGGRRRSLLVTLIVVVVVAGGAVTAYAFTKRDNSSSQSASGTPINAVAPSARAATTTKPKPTTTTTTVPPVQQPKVVAMPAPGGLSYGSSGQLVATYQQRLKDLHFDPGPVDGQFSQDTQYAVVAAQKYYNLPRTGRIDSALQLALSGFKYAPAEPTSEPDRVEIDLDKQVLTVFQNWQPILITTTSTGSGEYFCGGADGCQYAITPTGHFHFYALYMGWKQGKLGQMWNPYFFNGGIAVHGLQSVPAYPASHGCSRIPMFIADYFYTLVHQGESVFVVGTPMKAGNAYVGPVKTAPSSTTSTPASTTASTAPPVTTAVTTPKTTVPHNTTPSTKPTTPTTKKKP
jgi:peptidoglycan hydrolase-like protein with peptidoglycan-binding domain